MSTVTVTFSFNVYVYIYIVRSLVMSDATTTDLQVQLPEFLERPNQAYLYANFWFCTFQLGILFYANFFSADASQAP